MSKDRDEEVQVDARHLLAMRRFPGFAKHDVGDLSQMLQVFHEELFPRGSVLYERSQPISSVYFLLEGRVTVTHEGHTHDLDHGPLGVLEMLARTRIGGAVATTDVLALVAAPADLLDLFDERFTLLSMGLQSLGGEILRQLAALPPGRWPRLEWTDGRIPPGSDPRAGREAPRDPPLSPLGRDAARGARRAGPLERGGDPRRGHRAVAARGRRRTPAADPQRHRRRGAPVGPAADPRAGDEAGMVETLGLAPRFYDAIVAQPIRALRLGHDALLDAVEDQADLGIALLRSLAGDMIGLDAAQAGPA